MAATNTVPYHATLASPEAESSGQGRGCPGRQAAACLLFEQGSLTLGLKTQFQLREVERVMVQ